MRERNQQDPSDPLGEFLGNHLPKGLADQISKSMKGQIEMTACVESAKKAFAEDFLEHVKDGTLGYTAGVTKDAFVLRAEDGCPISQAVMGVIVAQMLTTVLMKSLRSDGKSDFECQAAAHAIVAVGHEQVQLMMKKQEEEK